MITIIKKPYGYTYTDFYNKRCFSTIDQLNSLKSFELVKRNATSLADMVFISLDEYDKISLYLESHTPYTQEVHEIVDDYLSLNVYKLFADAKVKNGSDFKLLKIMNTKSYHTTRDILTGEEMYTPVEVCYFMSKAQFDLIDGLY